jgi:hypothetical protein
MQKPILAFMLGLLATSAVHADDPKAPHPAEVKGRAADPLQPLPQPTTRTDVPVATTPAEIGPRHGGALVESSDGTHAEVLLTDHAVSVWFYDKELKPLPTPSEAKGTLKVDKETRKITLAKAGTEGALFVGGLAINTGARVELNIKAKVDGKTKTVRVEQEKFAPPAVPVPTTPLPSKTPDAPAPTKG